MNFMSRRRLMAGAPFVVLAAVLGGCEVSYTGGTAAVSVDVQKITTDTDAILTAFANALNAPSFAALLGAATVDTIDHLVDEIQASLTNVNTASGGVATVSVNIASVQGFVTTIVSDADQVLALMKAALPKLTASEVVTQVEDFLAAVSTLLPLIELAAGLAASTPVTGMTEAQAVATAYQEPVAVAKARLRGRR